MEQYDLAGQVIGLAMQVHSQLGPGFLERVYSNALQIELVSANLAFNAESPMEVYYLDKVVGEYIADLVVGNELIVEIKSVAKLVPAHEAQLVNYLTALRIDSGLLLNFGADRLEFKRKYRRRSEMHV